MKQHTKLGPVERDQIAVLLAKGRSFGDIARTLHRSRSTICDEVNRNGGTEGYVAISAQQCSTSNGETKNNGENQKPPSPQNRAGVPIRSQSSTGWVVSGTNLRSIGTGNGRATPSPRDCLPIHLQGRKQKPPFV